MMLLAAVTVSAQDLVDRVSQAVGVELPSEYKQKVKDYADTSNVMKDKGAAQFTEQFILEEMKKDWGISKQNQLLFIWTALIVEFDGEYIYDGSDQDENRLDEIDKVMVTFEECGKRYRTTFIAYCKQRSAEAIQQSAETVKRTMATLTRWVKEAMPEFYDLYERNPAIIKQEELTFMIESAELMIASCKKYNIDYHAILLKELGDKKKVDDLLKFYGIE